VTKLDAAGAVLVYSTYLGGSDEDVGNSIAVDGFGNAYVTGSTKSSVASGAFPTTSGAFQGSYGGAGDAFVTKLNLAGNGGTDLVYSSYLGGADEDAGFGIGVDSLGNAYVTGSTASPNFPIFDPIPGNGILGGGAGTSTDAFVTKVNATGAGIIYSTYLGGESTDVGRAIYVDLSNDVYVAGSTESSGFPTTSGAFDTSYGGLGDAFVTKITESGSSGGGTETSASSGASGGCFIATASAFEARK
jgi:hypothetical protein